jgi:hypothetical protein
MGLATDARPAKLGIDAMTPTDRRTLLMAGLAGLLIPALIPSGARAQQVDIGRATAFIQATGQELVAAINATNQPIAARREKVAQVLRRAVDVEGVGRFILGRWWRNATPEQQAEYLRLFEQVPDGSRSLIEQVDLLQVNPHLCDRDQQGLAGDAALYDIVRAPVGHTHYQQSPNEARFPKPRRWLSIFAKSTGLLNTR